VNGPGENPHTAVIVCIASVACCVGQCKGRRHARVCSHAQEVPRRRTYYSVMKQLCCAQLTLVQLPMQRRLSGAAMRRWGLMLVCDVKLMASCMQCRPNCPQQHVREVACSCPANRQWAPPADTWSAQAAWMWHPSVAPVHMLKSMRRLGRPVRLCTAERVCSGLEAPHSPATWV
jgi:hypothetical protein